MKIEEANKMTAQELCDYSVLKCVEQGGQSMDAEHHTCVMLSPNGRRCAFSWVLDENDPVCMSWKTSALGFISSYKKKSPQAFVSSPAIATALQDFHDNESTELRIRIADQLNTLGISTNAPQYQQWIDMGEGA